MISVAGQTGTLWCECPVLGHEDQVARTFSSLGVSGCRFVWADDCPADARGGVEGVGYGPADAVEVVVYYQAQNGRWIARLDMDCAVGRLPLARRWTESKAYVLDPSRNSP